MLLVYIATLAPSVTFWDAGEFIAAARVLGIPHPPGTPLFVVLLNAWARALSFLPFAAATNLFSAVCTAAAVGFVASVGRAIDRFSVVWNRRRDHRWRDVIHLAERDGDGSVRGVVVRSRSRSSRRRISPVGRASVGGRFSRPICSRSSLPLHLSAFVVAPVAIYLASQPVDDAFDWRTAIGLAGARGFVLGVSRLSVPVVAASVALILIASAERFVRRTDAQRRANVSVPAIATCAVMLVACSALLILVVRARHDPAINQANPSTLRDLAYVVGRRQYDVAGLWPRQAPVWLQLANWFEYADWQVALSLAPTVIPTIWRIAVTMAFAALAVFGASWHRRTDRRSWRAMVLLFVCGSLGVIVYLNLKAGTSFGWEFVPDAARHEARDRDYFFVLGFLAWGAWAGMGAMALAQRFRVSTAVGLGVAAIPLALNWGIVTRRPELEARMPRVVAKTLLDPLPPRTVLFVAGDNDTYPLWFAQQVEGRRKDVTVVTMPLLGAAWYVAELERREHLVGANRSGDPMVLARRIAESARAAGRPVAVSLMVPKDDRSRLGDAWIADGPGRDRGRTHLASTRRSRFDVDDHSRVTRCHRTCAGEHRAVACGARRSSVHGAGARVCFWSAFLSRSRSASEPVQGSTRFP